jgi:hypothetical protein
MYIKLLRQDYCIPVKYVLVKRKYFSLKTLSRFVYLCLAVHRLQHSSREWATMFS